MSDAFKSLHLEGRCLRFRCAGSEGPTVVIEQGQGHSVEREAAQGAPSGWTLILETLRTEARIVLHDRAGLGASTAAGTARTCAEMVADLRAVLEASGAPPPYLLVGHSVGGFNVRCFAGLHPAEVAGLVLVDSSHPDQARRLEALRAGGAVTGAPSRVQGASSEGIDFAACARQAAQVTSLGLVPLIVVSQSPHAFAPPRMPPQHWAALRGAWGELQRDLLKLSAASTQFVATHAGHFIPSEEPQLIIEAIRRVLGEVWGGRQRLH